MITLCRWSVVDDDLMVDSSIRLLWWCLIAVTFFSWRLGGCCDGVVLVLSKDVDDSVVCMILMSGFPIWCYRWCTFEMMNTTHHAVVSGTCVASMPQHQYADAHCHAIRPSFITMHMRCICILAWCDARQRGRRSKCIERYEVNSTHSAGKQRLTAHHDRRGTLLGVSTRDPREHHLQAYGRSLKGDDKI